MPLLVLVCFWGRHTLENSVHKSEILCGDNLKLLRDLDSDSIDACITDPPYGMGMDIWDHSVPPVETWKEVLRVLKPGAFCLSFCSPQLYHRMAVNLEDGGFLIQDQLIWMITTKMAKHNRLKPAHEPIAVGQKPLSESSIKKNQEKWGVGKIDIEDARVPWEGEPPTGWTTGGVTRRAFGKKVTKSTEQTVTKRDANPKGRYPSNIIGLFDVPEHQKYFYAPRVSKKERGEFNDHPTPKPIDLMQYLIKIYTPPQSIVLDPFCGSGSTGVAAKYEGRNFIGIDLDDHYCEITKRRMNEISSSIENY